MRKKTSRKPAESREPKSAFGFAPMTPADVPEAAAIERESTPSPWSEAQFRAELSKTFSRFWVVHSENVEWRKSNPSSILGFGGYWLLGPEAQLAELAVAPGSRRRGIGEGLVGKLMEEARAGGARIMSLEVRAGNTPARRLYEKLGFRETGRRPGFYEGEEDAALMEKSLC